MIIILFFIVKYTITCFVIQSFLFQLVDESNAEITLESFKNDIFRNDIFKNDFILEFASYTNLLKAFYFVKQQNDEIYNDTKITIATIFLNRVSSFH